MKGPDDMARLTKTLALIATLSLSASLSAPASAQTASSNDEACRAFAHYGGIVAAHILPLSVKDFADMNAGKNQRLVDAAMSRLQRDLTTRDKSALSRLGDENRLLFEEAATDFSMNAVLAGIGGTRQEIVSTMYQECSSAGPQEIINFQRALYQDQGQGTAQPQTR